MRSNKPKSAAPAGRSSNIGAIMKKFKCDQFVPQNKKNEKQVMFMQRNTLLEPNNFIDSWEGGGKEKIEVCSTLKGLR